MIKLDINKKLHHALCHPLKGKRLCLRPSFSYTVNDESSQQQGGDSERSF